MFARILSGSISTVEVKSDSEEHKLFDYNIPLNPGFVAVVGNKGQGKSALLDCIALAGNSSRKNEFAFLTPTRFLSPTSKKLAQEYYSELVWATGAPRRAQLPDDHDRSAPVYVEYLPQAFVERVCNTDPVTGDADEFERELRAVLFTHISEEERSGATSFDALLTQKTRTSQGDIDRRHDDLRTVIDSYVSIASFRAQNQLSEVDGRLSLKQAEVAAAEGALNAAKSALAEIDSSRGDNGQLAALTQRSDEIEVARAELLRKRTENDQRRAQARQALSSMEAVASRADALRAQVAELNAEADALMPDDGDPYLSLTINRARYDSWRHGIEEGLVVARDEHDGLVRDIAAQDEERRTNADELAAADSERERARQRVLQSEERVAALVGNENDEESLTGLRALREQITQAPGTGNALWLLGELTPDEAAGSGFSPDPAIRAAAIVRLFTDKDPDIHAAIRIAITSQSTRKRITTKLLHDVATSLVLRSVPEEDARKRERTRKYLKEALSGELAKEWEATFRGHEDLAAAADGEVASGNAGSATRELAARSAYPLVVSGALTADRGSQNSDQPDRRNPGEVIDRMRTSPRGVRQLRQALVDFGAGRKVRFVDEDGSTATNPDGAVVLASDAMLRRTYPRAGEGPAPVPTPKTAAELLDNALGEFATAVQAVETAVRKVEAVRSGDGTPAIDSLGADRADCDAWRNILYETLERFPIWKQKGIQRHGIENEAEPDDAEDEFDDDHIDEDVDGIDEDSLSIEFDDERVSP